MALPRKPKRSPAEGELLFEYGWQPAQETLTAYAGIPLFVRAARSFVLAGSVARHLRLKQRQRGFDEAAYVESLLVLNALGGDCLEDFDRLREDAGLAEISVAAQVQPNAAFPKNHPARFVFRLARQFPGAQPACRPPRSLICAAYGRITVEAAGHLALRHH